jgi:gamma-glutamylaminecyclotransferase
MTRMDNQPGLVLFVYGTLKRGCRSHGRLSDAAFLGVAWTKPLYRMYSCGAYPGLVFANAGESVEGELYRVNFDVVIALDRFEGVEYQRKPIELIEFAAEAWAYIFQADVSALPPCGPVWTDP